MRKSKPKKRYFLPDPIFKDTLVTQFVNNLMKEGVKKKFFDGKNFKKVQSPLSESRIIMSFSLLETVAYFRSMILELLSFRTTAMTEQSGLTAMWGSRTCYQAGKYLQKEKKVPV